MSRRVSVAGEVEFFLGDVMRALWFTAKPRCVAGRTRELAGGLMSLNRVARHTARRCSSSLKLRSLSKKMYAECGEERENARSRCDVCRPRQSLRLEFGASRFNVVSLFTSRKSSTTVQQGLPPGLQLHFYVRFTVRIPSTNCWSSERDTTNHCNDTIVASRVATTTRHPQRP